MLRNKSWKTSGSGWAVLLTTLGALLNALTDGDPSTNPDWNVALPQIGLAIGLICARDNNKSSEQVGAKNPLPPPPE